MTAETVTAMLAVVSPRNATQLVRNALTAVNGAAIVIVASSFGTAIFHRGMGESVRFASVRSSISFANAAAAIARTTSGAMEPASIALRIAFSNSRTDGALRDRSMTTAITTG